LITLDISFTFSIQVHHRLMTTTYYLPIFLTPPPPLGMEKPETIDNSHYVPHGIGTKIIYTSVASFIRRNLHVFRY